MKLLNRLKILKNYTLVLLIVFTMTIILPIIFLEFIINGKTRLFIKSENSVFALLFKITDLKKKI